MNSTHTPQHEQVFLLLREIGKDYPACCAALESAIEPGNVEAVQIILNHIRETFKSEEFGNRFILEAIKKSQRNILEYLLEEYQQRPLSSSFFSKQELILEAASVGNMEIIECLIQKGANLEAQDQNGNTLAHIAATYGHLQILKFLNDTQVFPFPMNHPNHKEETPLLLAITGCSKSDRLELIKYLHDSGCALTTFNLKANPLFHAILRLQFDIVEWMTVENSARLLLPSNISSSELEQLSSLPCQMIATILPYLNGLYTTLTAYFSLVHDEESKKVISDHWEKEIRKRVKQGQPLDDLLIPYIKYDQTKAYVFQLTLLLENKQFKEAEALCETIFAGNFTATTLCEINRHFIKQILLGHFKQSEPNSPLDNDDIFLQNPEIACAIRALYFFNKRADQQFNLDLRKEIDHILSGVKDVNINCTRETWLSWVQYYYTAYTLYHMMASNDDYPDLVKPFLTLGEKNYRIYQSAFLCLFRPASFKKLEISFSEEAELFFQDNHFNFQLVQDAMLIVLKNNASKDNDEKSGMSRASKAGVLATLAHYLIKAFQEKTIVIKPKLKGPQLIISSSDCDLNELATILKEKGFEQVKSVEYTF